MKNVLNEDSEWTGIFHSKPHFKHIFSVVNKKENIRRKPPMISPALWNHACWFCRVGSVWCGFCEESSLIINFGMEFWIIGPMICIINRIEGWSKKHCQWHKGPTSSSTLTHSMTMLTTNDCQRSSSHSPYILELYIWRKISHITQVLSDRLVGCPSSGVNSYQLTKIQGNTGLYSRQKWKF